ncbi:hypothetical protein B0J13DRAFT_484731 [Dactylonectria estremocensis]|uniref:Thioredoxin domain-containing protein n=1 Tax=Dactylonectria estremocensis TaxID=1079267 RepID=A0A9P9DQU4_9HYPO|nr:hypothetical protein B0J13DRAFT_484731 [Dactylonectria estremocensis]
MTGKVVSRDEWRTARQALLEKEKELTRANDALAAQLRALPMVKVDKTYTFEGPGNTKVTLSDLFQGQSQLIVYHFMFPPGDDEGCRGCSHIGESLPDVRHLRLKNTNLVCVSRGEIGKLETFRKKNEWAWPWYSSGESDFNYDFRATKRTSSDNETQGPAEDVPGFSVFLKQDGEIYHTYSTFARGGEKMMPTLMLLDITPLGRQIGQYGPAEFKLKHEY